MTPDPVRRRRHSPSVRAAMTGLDPADAQRQRLRVRPERSPREHTRERCRRRRRRGRLAGSLPRRHPQRAAVDVNERRRRRRRRTGNVENRPRDDGVAGIDDGVAAADGRYTGRYDEDDAAIVHCQLLGKKSREDVYVDSRGSSGGGVTGRVTARCPRRGRSTPPRRGR